MKIIVASLTALGIILVPNLSVQASGLGDWATGLQGTSEVFYSAPWLVSGVQFVIAWVCIIAFLTYYMSFLCSIVVLSNKELFYTIDALKRDASGGNEPSRGPFNGLLEKFRAGKSDAGLQGGADNIMVFILMLSLNFKAYSVYKNVDENSDGGGAGGGKGPKYAYSDTMASFFLKSLFDAVMVTFILSIALSGLLIRIWFTFGDVMISYADRFAQTNLTAMLDAIAGPIGLYDFTLSHHSGPDGQIGEQLARRAFAAILTHFPQMTVEQAQSLGVAVENHIINEVLGGTMGAPAITRLVDLANTGRASADQLVVANIVPHETAWSGFVLANVTLNNNPSGGNTSPGNQRKTIFLGEGNCLVHDMAGVMGQAGLVSPAGGLTRNYLHFTIRYVTPAGQGFVVEQSVTPEN